MGLDHRNYNSSGNHRIFSLEEEKIKKIWGVMYLLFRVNFPGCHVIAGAGFCGKDLACPREKNF